MLRFQLGNWVISFGFIFALFGLASTFTGLQQADSMRQEVNIQFIEKQPEIDNIRFSRSYLPNSDDQDLVEETTTATQRAVENNKPETTKNHHNLDDPLLPANESTSEVSEIILPVSAAIPVRITIPAIDLDAPIVQAEIRWVEVNGKEYQQWQVPNLYAAGWHESSARLGEVGNTVFNGHNNVYGEVFRRLDELGVGDPVWVSSGAQVFEYVITNTMILPERYQEIDVRMSNAQWIMPSEDQRLTLISCWPYDSNTHRVIVVAKLIAVEKQPEEY